MTRQPEQKNIVARLVGHILKQRHLYPLFPGENIDVPYLGLGELYNGAPDMLILPSNLQAFAKVTVT